MTLHIVIAVAEGMILHNDAVAAEEMIVVGELGGVVDSCVVVSIELRVSITNLLMLLVFKLGNLNFPFGVFGDIVGVGVLTEDVVLEGCLG